MGDATGIKRDPPSLAPLAGMLIGVMSMPVAGATTDPGPCTYPCRGTTRQ